MGTIWADSGHLSHLGHTWAPYRLFCPYKTLIGPILVKFDNYKIHSNIWDPRDKIEIILEK